MKLLVLFFVLSVRLCYAIDGYAQSTYFTLELNNKTVKEVFKAIEKNSEYVVFYYDGVVDVNRKVTIQAENKTVDQILDELFAGTSNIYEIKDRQIVISKKILPQEQQPQIKRITGKVVDEKGLVMPGATIRRYSPGSHYRCGWFFCHRCLTLQSFDHLFYWNGNTNVGDRKQE